MDVDEFDFDLPADLIAQQPTATRGASRLLHMEGATLFDREFEDLPRLIRPGDVLVLNDTRVIKARLSGTKVSGGKIEVLIERVLDDRRALAQLRASHPPAVGSKLRFPEGYGATLLERCGDFYRLEFDGADSVFDLLERCGTTPLPPYISRATIDADEARYQTVYAREPGAVAAPTAGLHFEEAMLGRLEKAGATLAYLTLHVGAGTFQPVRAKNIDEHRMHGERYFVPAQTISMIGRARACGGRVVAIGTTSARALEAAAQEGTLTAGGAETRIFIKPGYRFRVVDRLLTNFHLPRSTLFILVSAFAGIENTRSAYAHAIAQRYRFFSYGDAMLIERAA